MAQLECAIHIKLGDFLSELDCRYIIRSPLKQLMRSRYLYLFIIWSLQARACSKELNCATKAITSTFSMQICRKMPFSMHSKISLMAQVDQTLVIFLYWNAAQSQKVANILRIWRHLFWNKQSAYSEQMDSNCTMLQTVRYMYDHIPHMTQLRRVNVIGNRRMDSGLVFSLLWILQHRGQ